ncbi:MAG: hypothetical protein AAFY03_09985, partial [Pseudomonadota bacterium]
GWTQMSRKGGNLVIQLGFPSDHASLLGRHFRKEVRWKFEASHHPIRDTGRPTLAWARVDVEGDHMLIEEIQSDWLRFVSLFVQDLAKHEPQSRELRVHQEYERELVRLYAKRWPTAMLLATLSTAVEHFGVRHVWMHQPSVGAVLKGINGRQPPRSLYTQLPRGFCFEATQDVPPMLETRFHPSHLRRKKMRKLAIACRTGAPLFWHLDLGRRPDPPSQTELSSSVISH